MIPENVLFTLQPSVISYYLIKRWKEKNYNIFFDLGCGNGRHTNLFANSGFQSFALDISDDMLLKSRLNCEAEAWRICFSLGDMRALPYEDEMFECILCYHVIYHTDTLGVKKALSELYRVLHQDGEAYLTFMSKESWHWKHASKFVDSHTFLKEHSKSEVNVPHFCVNNFELIELLSSFKIIKKWCVTQEINIDGKSHDDCHFHVLLKK